MLKQIDHLQYEDDKWIHVDDARTDGEDEHISKAINRRRRTWGRT